MIWIVYGILVRTVFNLQMALVHRHLTNRQWNSQNIKLISKTVGLFSYLEFAIDREVEWESSKVERKEMTLRVVEAGMRRAEAVLDLLDRWRNLRRVKAHAAEEKTIHMKNLWDTTSNLFCFSMN